MTREEFLKQLFPDGMMPTAMKYEQGRLGWYHSIVDRGENCSIRIESGDYFESDVLDAKWSASISIDMDARKKDTAIDAVMDLYNQMSEAEKHIAEAKVRLGEMHMRMTGIAIAK
jgi:hypothetical protein